MNIIKSSAKVDTKHEIDNFISNWEFLRIYNYPKQEDKMSTLHTKVIFIDQTDTLITSANIYFIGMRKDIFKL